MLGVVVIFRIKGPLTNKEQHVPTLYKLHNLFLFAVSRGEDNYSMMAEAKKPLNPAPPPVSSKPEPNEHPGLAPGSSANTSVANALKGVEFIAQHIKDEDRDNEVSSSTVVSEELAVMVLWFESVNSFISACFVCHQRIERILI